MTLVFKVLLVGDQGTGKSSLLERYLNRRFLEHQQTTTFGVDFYSKTIETKDKPTIKLFLCECTSLEKFASILPLYYKTADAILYCYDDVVSLTGIRKWMIDCQNHCAQEHLLQVSVRTKMDRKMPKSTSEHKLPDFASNVDFQVETSAKDDKNVHELFRMVGDELLKRCQHRLTFQIHATPPKPTTSNCWTGFFLCRDRM